jgi:hypothetical protein
VINFYSDFNVNRYKMHPTLMTICARGLHADADTCVRVVTLLRKRSADPNVARKRCNAYVQALINELIEDEHLDECAVTTNVHGAHSSQGESTLEHAQRNGRAQRNGSIDSPKGHPTGALKEGKRQEVARDGALILHIVQTKTISTSHGMCRNG